MVVVQDGGTPPRSATGTAHITVLDENDNAPNFTHARPEQELLFQVRIKGDMSVYEAYSCIISLCIIDKF